MISTKLLKVWIMMLFVFSALLACAFYALPDFRPHIYFLDAGQGDAILVRTPNDRFVLIDGGPDDKVLTELSDVMPFFSRRIDLVILTHAHSDHINGLVSVLKRYDVPAVLITGAVAHGSYYDEFMDIIAGKNIRLFIAESGNDFDFGGGVFLDILYPVESIFAKKIENTNNASIVSKLVYGKSSALLTGDAENESEKEQLSTDFDLSADILKAGHHGSRTASSPAYLKSVNPEIAVIQCGAGNKFSHPHPETLTNLSGIGVQKIYRTDLNGRVRFSFD